MQNSVIIHGVTKEEFLGAIKDAVKESLAPTKRDEYSIKEIAKMTGYSRPHLRKVIKEKGIPYHYDGKEIMVAAEFIGKFKSKF